MSLRAYPVGLTFGQDYEAVNKRLIAAVEAEEITGEEAQMMMSALKKARGPGDRDAGEQTKDQRCITKEEYSKTEVKLRKAVENGRISGEDARARLAAMRK